MFLPYIYIHNDVFTVSYTKLQQQVPKGTYHGAFQLPNGINITRKKCLPFFILKIKDIYSYIYFTGRISHNRISSNS